MNGRAGPLCACLLTLAACRQESPAGSRIAPDPRASAAAPGRVLTLGDIDPDTPALKLERIEPLARYLAPELAAVGVSDVRIRIAPSIDRMIELMNAGEVDVYLDSLYPTLQVRQRSGSRIILRTWVGDLPEYHSMFIARRDGGVRKLSDLTDRVIAFEEPHSTSGFFLPALHLRRGGHPVDELDSADARPEAGAIGYVFSGDAENTVERVLRGSVAAGAISNEDYDALSEAGRARLRVLSRTISIPRRLVSVRRGLPEAVTRALSVALVAVAEKEPVVLEDALRAWSWKCDPLTPDVVAAIEQLATSIVEPD